MTTSPPSSVKSEPSGPLYSDREPSASYTSLLDTSLDHSLPVSADAIPPPSTSIPIEPSSVTSDDLPFDNLQGYSAPTLPVYINMGLNERPSDVRFAGPMATNEAHLSRSLAAIDIDRPQPSATTPTRHSQHHHHHFPHHAQNRNRYPYLSRQVIGRSLNPTSVSRASVEGLPYYYEQRPAFRRSYFALRRQRIPKAPPMPRHLLFPGYRKPARALSKTEESGDTGAEVDEEEEGPPSKSFWIILRLVFFFFAIEFMYAVETALTIPIFSTLHVSETYLSMAWLVSPILGFFVQPIIGMWSDTCKCRWGRRRPFILAFAIGAYMGVTLLLNGADLGLALGDPKTNTSNVSNISHISNSSSTSSNQLIGIGLTAVGVTFLDFCADSADAPIRAYLIDTVNPSDQERGFNIHAILGFGGGLGYVIGALHMPKVPIFHSSGGEFSVIYFVASFLFIFCTIATLTSVREEPLISSSSTSSRRNGDIDNSNEDETNEDDDQPEIESDESRPLLSVRRGNAKSYDTTAKPRSAASIFFNELNSQEGFRELDPTGKNVPYDHVERTSEDILLQNLERTHQVVATSLASADPSNPTPIPTQAFEAELKQKAKLVKLGLMRRTTSEDSDEYDKEDQVTVKSMLISMVRMPPRLWKLMICQVIGWIGYFATHLYYTDYVASVIWKGSMEHGEQSDEFVLYKYGVSMGCWGLFVYSASSAVYAFCLERWLSERFSLNVLYFVGYFVYTIGCLVNFFLPYTGVTIAMCFTFGMLVVSLNTIPYHMLSQFHADETYRNRDGTKRGIGIDCSLLNACYFLGEFVMAVSLGPILDSIGTKYCMILGATFTTIGNISMFFLFFFKQK